MLFDDSYACFQVLSVKLNFIPVENEWINRYYRRNYVLLMIATL